MLMGNSPAHPARINPLISRYSRSLRQLQNRKELPGTIFSPALWQGREGGSLKRQSPGAALRRLGMAGAAFIRFLIYASSHPLIRLQGFCPLPLDTSNSL
jgi:hypothetical protein